ncbi:hypothetical protein L1049_008578 [Liquidambar formosana]|uniref:Uncharacterized protein n=1 Tax=Liquidambar formosana TaxID=63359 RepID=A0AAP0X2F1_LIQFO
MEVWRGWDFGFEVKQEMGLRIGGGSLMVEMKLKRMSFLDVRIFEVVAPAWWVGGLMGFEWSGFVGAVAIPNTNVADQRLHCQPTDDVDVVGYDGLLSAVRVVGYKGGFEDGVDYGFVHC